MPKKMRKPIKKTRRNKAATSDPIPQPAPGAKQENAKAKERNARKTNAEKQKRFRESMKTTGARQTLLWDFPPSPATQSAMKSKGYVRAVAWENHGISPRGKKMPQSGLVKVSTTVHENSLQIAHDNAEIGEALSRVSGSFIDALKGVPREKWTLVYQDIREFLSHFGNVD
jgi:hypothetical protein